MRRAIALFVLVAFASACGALPKPFQQEGLRAPKGLITLLDGGAIRIEVEPSLPGTVKDPLESAMIKALARSNVPASAMPEFRAEYILKSNLLIDRPDVAEPEVVTFTWTLFNLTGLEIGAFDQSIQGDQTGWLVSDPQLFTVIAQDAARQLAALIQTDPNAEPLTAEAAADRFGASTAAWAPRIYLMEVDGAPGDGNSTLQRSLEFILSQEGSQLVAKREDANYLVKGFVNVSPPIAGMNDVAITWLVTSGDGKEIGKITQNNKVRAGTLDQRWGRLAFAVANGASLGIKGVVGRDIQRKRNPPALEIPFR